jgi:hypothetical protein
MKKVKLNTSRLRIKKETIVQLSADMQAGIKGGDTGPTVENQYCNPGDTYQFGCVMSFDNACGGTGGGGGVPTGGCGVIPTRIPACPTPSLADCRPPEFTIPCVMTDMCVM